MVVDRLVAVGVRMIVRVVVSFADRFGH